MEYKIIRVVSGEKGVPKSGDTFPELEELVNIEMEKGWRPIGGPAIIIGGPTMSGTTSTICQALVKRD